MNKSSIALLVAGVMKESLLIGSWINGKNTISIEAGLPLKEGPVSLEVPVVNKVPLDS